MNARNEEVAKLAKADWMLKDTLQVDIVSAEESIYSGRAKLVVVTGHDGELGILPGHAQLLTTVRPGQIRLVKSDGEEEYYYVSGGFLEVEPEVVTVLADTVLRADDIDAEKAEEAKEKAKKRLAEKHLQLDDYTAALVELTKAIAQLRVARKKGRL